MSQQENEFLKMLLAAFCAEAGEHLQAMSAGLLELEKTTDRTPRRRWSKRYSGKRTA